MSSETIMSHIFNQLSDRKGDSTNGPPPASRDTPPKPGSSVQLELGLTGIQSDVPLSRPAPVRRARQPAAASVLPADQSALRDLQAKLADARAALARNEERQEAAARLHGPQIVPVLFGRSKKIQVWIKIFAIASVAVLLCGLGALLFSQHRNRPANYVTAAVDALPGEVPVPAATPARIKLETGHSPNDAAATGGRRIAPVFAATYGASLPTIELKGLQARPVDGGLKIIFDKGVFSRRAILSDEAGALLQQLAGQLRHAMPTCRLEITGHTDPEPIRDGAIPDNRALGLQRARAVAEYLTTQCSLPADALSMASAGDANAPYPNTTPELRRKNRTVTIIVAPR